MMLLLLLRQFYSTFCLSSLRNIQSQTFQQLHCSPNAELQALVSTCPHPSILHPENFIMFRLIAREVTRERGEIPSLAGPITAPKQDERNLGCKRAPMYGGEAQITADDSETTKGVFVPFALHTELEGQSSAALRTSLQHSTAACRKVQNASDEGTNQLQSAQIYKSGDIRKAAPDHTRCGRSSRGVCRNHHPARRAGDQGSFWRKKQAWRSSLPTFFLVACWKVSPC
ncbi:hypothetical protein BJ508DRAFT_415748 [Ascobolus immersus RN42]|uniref:Uncharacterized protein n=1 Tax=Ascobolus immersus RN42 TaxID=1160509 RepID=A0A3N4IDC9_ASCIM|nr:hypothetical protein BJ508DRAFT_415748 [Ascobolus immersus RN42]